MKRILVGVQDKLLKLKMSTAYWEKSFHYNSSDNDDSQLGDGMKNNFYKQKKSTDGAFFSAE